MSETPWLDFLADALTEYADSLVLNADAWAASGLSARQIVGRHQRARQAIAQLEARRV